MKFFKRVVTALSGRADYGVAISAIQEAIRSEKLTPQDKKQMANGVRRATGLAFTNRCHRLG